MLFPFAALLLALTARLAFPQPVASVPADVRAIMVFLCDRKDGCSEEGVALGTWATALGMPVLDFEAVVLEGPDGLAARNRFVAAMDRLEEEASLEAAREAREALKEYPFNVLPEDLLKIHLILAARLLDAGYHAEAAEAFSVAAAVSGGRFYNLPELSPESLSSFHEAIRSISPPDTPPAVLHVTAQAAEARVWVDGEARGLAPVSVTVLPGWHRVVVERNGRRTAWVGEVKARPGWVVEVPSEVHVDDGSAAIEAAIAGVIRGEPAPSGIVASLFAWARANDLEFVRFVTLERPAASSAPPDDVVIDPEGNRWNLRDTWLDARTGRFTDRGPGNAVLRTGARLSRFRAGVNLGYLHLAPLHHVAIEGGAIVGLRPRLALDARVGVIRSNRSYFLYHGWVDPHLYPVSAGLRLGRPEAGPHATLSVVAFVPYAVGGMARAGWEIAPSTWWRIDLEASGGWTDKGWLAGGTVGIGRRY